MEEIKQRLIVLVLDNWDLLSPLIVSIVLLALGWAYSELKRRALKAGMGIVVAAVEQFADNPPPINVEDTDGLKRIKGDWVKKAFSLLKDRIGYVSTDWKKAPLGTEGKERIKYYTKAGNAIHNTVKQTDTKY